jgi:hypothetical protein
MCEVLAMKALIELFPVIVLLVWAVPSAGAADGEGGLTTLTNLKIRYTAPAKPYAVLRRGVVEAVVVDNSAVDDEVLPGHKAGYSGLASLKHDRRRANLFVPAYSGLNFEHSHDGTTQDRKVLFIPRSAPMHLRQISEHIVELYQPPTPHYQLESCLRYEMLADGTIEMTLECIPRDRTFRNGYIGLFFASYIDHPESLDIHFLGRDEGAADVSTKWILGVTSAHGKLSTHRAVGDDRTFAHDPDFPLSLVFSFSNHRYSEPWYYGVSHGMAYVLVFRDRDRVRLTQSPSGAGPGNPAWDFQWFVPEFQVDRPYVFVMRAMYLPFESPEQIARAVVAHRDALNVASTRPAGG